MELIRVFDRVAKKAEANRELAWLEARMHDDRKLAGELEKLDPELIERLRRSHPQIEDRDGERSAARHERFARLHDECFERHARSVGLSRRHIEELRPLPRHSAPRP